MADPAGAVGFGDVARLVQTAVTPVFLLSGIGTLLNVFNTRLARVSDQLEHAADLLRKNDEEAGAALMRAHIRRLCQRRLVLDTSVVMGAIGGTATCAAAFVLFLSGVRDSDLAAALVTLFGLALACTVIALGAFLADGVLAWHSLRQEGPMPRGTPEVNVPRLNVAQLNAAQINAAARSPRS